jgi:hypothetical protein
LALRGELVEVLPQLLGSRAGALAVGFAAEKGPRALGKREHLPTALDCRHYGVRCRVVVEQAQLDHLGQARVVRDRGEECRHHGIGVVRLNHRVRDERIFISRRAEKARPDLEEARFAQRPEADQGVAFECAQHMDVRRTLLRGGAKRDGMHEHVRRRALGERCETLGHGRIGRPDVDGNHSPLALQACDILYLPPCHHVNATPHARRIRQWFQMHIR